jgi:hypothetical protein
MTRLINPVWVKVKLPSSLRLEISTPRKPSVDPILSITNPNVVFLEFINQRVNGGHVVGVEKNVIYVDYDNDV